MAKEFGVCRDCKNWLVTQETKIVLESLSRELHPNDGFIQHVCNKIINILNISVSNDIWSTSSVDSIATDANFGCVLFEKVEN